MLKQIGGTAANIALAIALAWVLTATLHGQFIDPAEDKNTACAPGNDLCRTAIDLQRELREIDSYRETDRTLAAPALACQWKEWRRLSRHEDGEPNPKRCVLLQPGDTFRYTNAVIDPAAFTAIRSDQFKGVRFVARHRLREKPLDVREEKTQ